MTVLSSRHLLTIQDLSKEDIINILDTARTFREVNEREIKKLPTLRGKTIVNLFLENSTRTRMSFEVAEKRLSADTVNMSGSSSSTSKGESLADTAETINAYNVDAVVIRHRYAGSPYMLTQHMDPKVHILNAGDGKHQHPTQTLLDLYTMREAVGGFEGKKVAIVGDIMHSRVAGSLCPALNLLGADVTVVGPATLLPARPDVLGAKYTYDLDEVIEDVDVLYMLRIQQERLDDSPFPTLREYSMLYGIDKDRLARLKKDAVVMHPGPINRGVELMSEAADSDRAKILDQVNAGLLVRMATMYLMLGGESDVVTA